MSLAGLTGLVVFANYAGCDPISLGFIKRSDQITPFYVLDQLSTTVGILGLFIACLFSGALRWV
jgi:sodium-coupled monocarboxylate transporter 8/12